MSVFFFLEAWEPHFLHRCYLSLLTAVLLCALLALSYPPGRQACWDELSDAQSPAPG